MVTMLVDMFLCLPPIICLIAFKTISVNIVMGVTLVLLILMTALFYQQNNRAAAALSHSFYSARLSIKRIKKLPSG